MSSFRAKSASKAVEVEARTEKSMEAMPQFDCEDSSSHSPFSNAVYKELSKINGKINQMSRIDMERQLRKLKLSTEGTGDVLKKRLKNYYTKKKLADENLQVTNNLYPYYVIIDFEATCEEVNDTDFPHEIIEFPAILVSTQSQDVVDEFHAYCRPVVRPNLSQFCIELTGITQEQVNNAESFPEVLARFEQWLHSHRLVGKNRVKSALVTDGPWDMGRFLYGQCKISSILYPSYCKRWVNVRKIFSALYKSKRLCLGDMLQQLGMDFEGRPHCGMDDARNIARILLRLAADGGRLLPNERISLHTSPAQEGKRERRVYSIMYDSTGSELKKKPSPQQYKHTPQHHNHHHHPADLVAEFGELSV